MRRAHINGNETLSKGIESENRGDAEIWQEVLAIYYSLNGIVWSPATELPVSSARYEIAAISNLYTVLIKSIYSFDQIYLQF